MKTCKTRLIWNSEDPGILGSFELLSSGFPLPRLSAESQIFFGNPQVELLKLTYKNFQNTDQRYPCYGETVRTAV